MVPCFLCLWQSAVIVGLIYLSRRNPQKFLKYGDEAIATARQTTDKEQQKEIYKEAERNYKKAYGYSKTDELKIVGLHHLANLYIETGDWRNVMGCWTQIVRLDPKDINARYNRLKYFYIFAQTVSGEAWQEVATQAGEFIEMIETLVPQRNLQQKIHRNWKSKRLNKAENRRINWGHICT